MSLYGCFNDGSFRRECNDCQEEELSKIVHVAFVLKSAISGITLTNPTTLITGILAAEVACNAYVIRNVSGSYDGGTYTEGKGPGKQASRITGGAHVVSITDFDYTNNVAFWNNFKKTSGNYYAFAFTDTYAWYIDKPLTVLPKPGFAEDSTATIGENAIIEIKWQSKDNPQNYKADVDTLESCPSLFDYDELTWAQTSGSMASINGSVFTVDQSAGVYLELDTTISLADVEVVGGELPTGISVSVSDDVIILSGAGSVVGSFEAIIKAYNTCGVSTQFSVTFIVE